MRADPQGTIYRLPRLLSRAAVLDGRVRRQGNRSVSGWLSRTSITAVTCLGLLLPSSATLARDARPDRPLNVLFIISDDLAARLGTYGAPVLSPNIDRLATQGVTFDRAYSQYPWCGPSRASFLTSVRPDRTGVHSLETSFRAALPDILTLPEYFKTHGYFSGRIGKVFHQGVPNDIGTSGLDDPQSWNEVVNPRGRDRDAEDDRLINLTPGQALGNALAYLPDSNDRGSLRMNLTPGIEAGAYLADQGLDEEQTDGKVATAAIDMLRRNKDRPFFIAVGFYRPHVPEVVPKKYFDPYPLEKIRLPDETPASLARVLPASKAWVPDNFGLSPDQQRQMIRSYYAATSFMDAQVGRVLDALKELGLDDNTIVVFTSDHGYMLGEHGQWMKKVLWEQSDRVPLIIRAPRVPKGQRSGKTVELLDLYPTLTDMAGLPHYARNEGTSLVPLLANPRSARWSKPAFSQVEGGRSVRTERWRYTEWQGGEKGRELYDHRADPLEHNNQADDSRYAGIANKLHRLLANAPVQRRAPPASYDPVRGCLIRNGPVPAKPLPDTHTVSSGDSRSAGKGGVKYCDALDP